MDKEVTSVIRLLTWQGERDLEDVSKDPKAVDSEFIKGRLSRVDLT